MTNSIQIAQHFTLTSRGLSISGKPSFAECHECFDGLTHLEKSIQFAIGDLLNHMELHYGETYAQLADETEYTVKTLQNYKYVASAIEISRRKEDLSWSHHAAVASEEPNEQERLLNKAKHEGMSSHDLNNERTGKKMRELQLDDVLCAECLDRLTTLTRNERLKVVNKLSQSLLEQPKR